MGKPVEITGQVVALSQQYGLIYLLLKRRDLPDPSEHLKPKNQFSMEDIMGGAQQMAAQLLKKQIPEHMNKRDKIDLVLAKEEYEKIGSPHISSQIKIQVSMEGE